MNLVGCLFKGFFGLGFKYVLKLVVKCGNKGPVELDYWANESLHMCIPAYSLEPPLWLKLFC